MATLDVHVTNNRATIEPWQRFTRSRPCPICGGGDNDRRRRGERCAGYLSDDERYAFCTREEYAGALQPRQTAVGDTYKHRLDGPCWCNGPHETAAIRPAPARTPEPTPVKARKVYTAIPERCPALGMEAYRKTATYDYRDADGALRYIIVRYEGLDAEGERDKALRPFRPVEGGWVNTRAEVTLLYRLPDLLAADPWAPVYICEGEKDADRLAAGGLVATTNAFGAGSWDMVGDAPAILSGRQVVIVEHNDQAGRDRTTVVAASLEEKAASIRVMRFPELPEHGDVFDWLDAGHTVGELHRLSAALPVLASEVPQTLNSNPAIQLDTPTETSITCAGCVRLTRQLRISEEARKIAETSLTNLRKEQAMTKRILAMPKEQLSPALKPAAIAVRDILSRPRARDDDGLEQVYRREIAQQCGVTDQTASTYLRELASAGIIRREVTKSFDRSEIRIAEGPLFDEPEQVEEKPASRTWGGRRTKVCATCGSLNLETRIVCRDCGALHSSEDTNRPEQLEDDDDLRQSLNSWPAIQLDTPGETPLPTQADGGAEQGDTQDYSPPLDLIVVDLASQAPGDAPDDAPAIPSMRLVSAPAGQPCPECGGATYLAPIGRMVCRTCLVPIGSVEAS